MNTAPWQTTCLHCESVIRRSKETSISWAHRRVPSLESLNSFWWYAASLQTTSTLRVTSDTPMVTVPSRLTSAVWKRTQGHTVSEQAYFEATSRQWIHGEGGNDMVRSVCSWHCSASCTTGRFEPNSYSTLDHGTYAWSNITILNWILVIVILVLLVV